VLNKDTYNALLFLAAMMVSIISFVVLKNTFQITRPGIELMQLTGWSFPSGHATVATAFFFTLSHAFFNWFDTYRARAFLVGGSILGTLLICFSRLYLGAHWGLDILAGIALGLLSVSFTVLIFNLISFERIWKKKNRRGL
jgi:undecaprenyl-diphosphatase